MKALTEHRPVRPGRGVQSQGDELPEEAMKTRRSAIPLYSLTEVARYARARPENVRRWFLGDTGARSADAALLEPAHVGSAGEAAASFENLIETAVVAALRSRGLSLQAVRAAHRHAAAEFGDHPFARHEVWVASRALEPVLVEYLHHVDWQEGRPVEWRPLGGVVRQNPVVEFGRPHVDGIRTEVLRDRFQAGETIAELVSDFSLRRDHVEHALRYELWLRPAA